MPDIVAIMTSGGGQRAPGSERLSSQEMRHSLRLVRVVLWYQVRRRRDAVPASSVLQYRASQSVAPGLAVSGALGTC